jgi:hypothetical protein
MAKVLNIESLEVPKKSLTLGGVDYPVEELSVENFIVTTQEAKRLEGETDHGVQMVATVDMIMRSIPTIPREKLTALSIEQLVVIVKFVQGSLEEGAAGVTEQDPKK